MSPKFLSLVRRTHWKCATRSKTPVH